METEVMGRVLTEVTIENLKDLWDCERGMIQPDQVRRIQVADALVDTGATGLALPSRIIRQLGLVKRYEKQGTASIGVTTLAVYEAVRLTIMGRDMTIDAVEVSDDVPVLVGQIPLEYLDFVVDPKNRKLIGNPAHGGEQMLEMY